MTSQTELPALMQMLLSSFAPQVPVILVVLMAVVVIVVKWKLAPQACLWALLGFGLRLILCIVMPVAQTLVHYRLMNGQHSAQQTGVLLSALGFLWAGLVAVSYVLLLVAVFAGRSKPTA